MGKQHESMLSVEDCDGWRFIVLDEDNNVSQDVKGYVCINYIRLQYAFSIIESTFILSLTGLCQEWSYKGNNHSTTTKNTTVY